MNKRLIIAAGLLLMKTSCPAQLYIGVTDNAIFDYFPKADVKKIKLKATSDSIGVLVMADDMKGIFWYDIHRQMVVGYQINPIDKALYTQLETGLNKGCLIVKPEQEWSCKKNDYLIKVTKKPTDGPNNTVVDIFHYELVK